MACWAGWRQSHVLLCRGNRACRRERGDPHEPVADLQPAPDCLSPGTGRQWPAGRDGDSPMYCYVEEIVHAGESAVTLTNQLLTFSRRQIVSPQVLDVNGLLGGMETVPCTAMSRKSCMPERAR